ncbi:glycerophosphodiester phosphodiesterase family protein [Corynebacterium epidermidicanis]|uniref:Glycerophosphoryl diester phosphodiesterase n=1 Tax=Corynebacterium epidermidicanis TaxID=1050174 RepID=A0A0G3GUK6_9CORY|nr:glycerophosphodiester phosphodiesterase family protein [Corynebacterium epidermidicanis]AKK04185.1 glycerophosphoryl diester phosphodiesterase [Corynebacterium epidermidicanis]
MQIIAHRGASGDFPELTMLAFEQAIEQGADAIECDIRLTRDGKVVCVHDPNISRVANGTAIVERSTYDELCSFNFGTAEQPQRPALLDELLELIKAHPTTDLYIETKHLTRWGRMIEEQAVMRLRYAGLIDDPRIHVISFFAPAMIRMREIAPQVDRIFLREESGPIYQRMISKWGNPSGLGLSLTHARLNPDLIAERDLPTYMWTVDEPEDIAWALDMGVDMLATNYPARAREVLAGKL